MSVEQKLCQTIYNTVRKICKEVGTQLEMEYESDAVDLIAELTYKKLISYGSDLEAFERHAKRATINADDVKLLVRRNNSLKELIDSKTEQNQASTTEVAANKRKRKATGSTS